MDAKILIANRGEIALRVVRACHELGLPCVVVYSEADKDSLPVRLADSAVCIGPGPAMESYLRPDRILSAAEQSGATAIHPGYGFLSENGEFAELCTQCGFKFIGPTAEAIRAMGCKTVARRLMIAGGVPVTPGSDDELPTLASARSWAERLGYPVLLKAATGGGGKGMRVVNDETELEGAYNAACSESETSFRDSRLFMEKYVKSPKHVEVQILGDNYGHVVSLGDRDCSLQRRHQKMIEEAPCSVLDPELRKAICRTAVTAAKTIGYSGAGTVEFLLDEDGHYYFMEMNTRIQVEHPVTESVTSIDLVQAQIRVALGEPLPFRQEDIECSGHAIEIRLNAEDPQHGFSPAPGHVSFLSLPGGPGVRMDTHLYAGCDVPPYYDSLLGKLVVHGSTREEAIVRARRALSEFVLEGVPTTRDFASEVIASPMFRSGRYTTTSLEEFLASGGHC